tara:strand:- start:10346 stop:11110 length:765 start_codon:yes stop_codon:yes gene_type:complete
MHYIFKIKNKIRKTYNLNIWRLYKLFNKDFPSKQNVNLYNHLVRLGGKYAGWTVPSDVLDKHSICYCVGCGEDISFDLELMETYGCDVYGFDPTPRAIDYVTNIVKGNDKYHFSPVGLWSSKDEVKFYEPSNSQHVSHSVTNLQKTKKYFIGQVDRLINIAKLNGHKKIDFLKMDIEGAEYTVLQTIIEDSIDIDILCVEFDEWQLPVDKRYKARIKEAIVSLINYGYRLIYHDGDGNYTFMKNKTDAIKNNDS